MLPFICTHSLKQVCKREKNKCAERREKQLSRFYTALVEFYIEEVLRGFLPYGFPKENICVLCITEACCSFNGPAIVNCFRISSNQLRKLNMVSEPPLKETLHI